MEGAVPERTGISGLCYSLNGKLRNTACGKRVYSSPDEDGHREKAGIAVTQNKCSRNDAGGGEGGVVSGDSTLGQGLRRAQWVDW